MPRHEHAEQSFTAIPQSIGAARTFIEQTLKAWRLTGRADDVRLCVSELASNAVNHGTHTMSHCGAFQVRIDADDAHIRIEVEDSEPLTAPRVCRAMDGEPGGRGMLIIDTLATAWGYESHAPSGKIVWSEFPTSPA